jgi:hypothetical protein
MGSKQNAAKERLKLARHTTAAAWRKAPSSNCVMDIRVIAKHLAINEEIEINFDRTTEEDS